MVMFHDLPMKNDDFPWFFVCLPGRVSHHHPVPTEIIAGAPSETPSSGQKMATAGGAWQNLLMCKYPLVYLLYYTSSI